MSNTGTVALMLPIVVSLAANAHINSSRLLMPLAFASSMGGMMTLIGTPPNLVIQNALTNAGFEPLTFFSFLPVGLICVFVGMVVLMPLSKIFLTKRGTEKSDSKNKNKSLNELAREYQAFREFVSDTNPRKIDSRRQNDCRVEYSPTISFEYIGGTAHCFVAVPVVENGQSEIGRSGYCITLRRCVVCEWRFRKSEGICFSVFFGIIDAHTIEDGKGNLTSDLAFYDIGIAEIVLMPSSRLLKQTVGDSGFREKFNVNVLGIRRKNDYILHDLKDVKMLSGDVLLVQGTWKDIARLSSEDSDWVVLGQPLSEAAKVTLDYKGSGRCCDYAFNDSYDGVRFYTSGSGYGCDDCCDTYGIDRLFQECGGSL